MQDMHLWLQELAAGDAERLLDILDHFGPRLFAALASLPQQQQVARIVKALRRLEVQAKRFPGAGDAEAFIAEALARSLRLPLTAITETKGLALPPQLRMQVIRQLAQSDAKRDRRQQKFMLVGTAVGLIFIFAALALLLSLKTGGVKYAFDLAQSRRGTFTHIASAPDADVWVVVDHSGLVHYVAQPDHPRPTNTTIGTLQLPSDGEIVAILPDGDLLLATADTIQRLGLTSQKWVLPKPRGSFTYLSNGLLVCYDRQSRQVYTCDADGHPVQASVALPVAADDVRFLPAQDTWVAVVAADNAFVFDHQGNELLRLPHVISSDQLAYDATSGRYALLDTNGELHLNVGDDQAELVALHPGLRSGSYQGWVTGVPGGWIVVAENLNGQRNAPAGKIAYITHDAILQWQRPYIVSGRSGVAGLDLLQPQVVAGLEAGVVVYSYLGSRDPRLAIIDIASGEPLGMLDTSVFTKGVSLALAQGEIPWLAVIQSNHVHIYAGK
ncbi:MAG: hypothetical protein GX060_02205 [Firmicutes bacterium]|nr:hypothetical protein [Bacillota bacterium]